MSVGLAMSTGKARSAGSDVAMSAGETAASAPISDGELQCTVANNNRKKGIPKYVRMRRTISKPEGSNALAVRDKAGRTHSHGLGQRRCFQTLPAT